MQGLLAWVLGLWLIYLLEHHKIDPIEGFVNVVLGPWFGQSLRGHRCICTGTPAHVSSPLQ